VPEFRDRESLQHEENMKARKAREERAVGLSSTVTYSQQLPSNTLGPRRTRPEWLNHRLIIYYFGPDVCQHRNVNLPAGVQCIRMGGHRGGHRSGTYVRGAGITLPPEFAQNFGLGPHAGVEWQSATGPLTTYDVQ